VLRQLSNDDEKYMAFKMIVPTQLHLVDRTTAEVTRTTWEQLDLPCDTWVDERVLRKVELSTRDQATSNDRAERSYTTDRPKRIRLSFACDDHVANTVFGWGMKLLQPLDTNLVRMALASRGSENHVQKTHTRTILAEQLVIFYGGAPTAEADRHREKVYSTYMDAGDSDTLFRKVIVSRLWNGDIRKQGTVEHYERGCCNNAAHTLVCMQTVGLDSLYPPSGHRQRIIVVHVRVMVVSC